MRNEELIQGNKWKDSDNVAQLGPNSNLAVRFKKNKPIFLMVRDCMCKSEPPATAGGF